MFICMLSSLPSFITGFPSHSFIFSHLVISVFIHSSLPSPSPSLPFLTPPIPVLSRALLQYSPLTPAACSTTTLKQYSLTWPHLARRGQVLINLLPQPSYLRVWGWRGRGCGAGEKRCGGSEEGERGGRISSELLFLTEERNV